MAGSDSVFTLVPRRRLIGLSFGAMQSARRGAGSDILGSRPYVRGDDVPVVIQDPVWEQSFPDVAGVVVPLLDPRSGRLRPVRLSAREVAERREANERRLASLIGRLRDFEIEPVLVSSDEPLEILYSFLEWSDWRKAARRRSW